MTDAGFAMPPACWKCQGNEWDGNRKKKKKKISRADDVAVSKTSHVHTSNARDGGKTKVVHLKYVGQVLKKAEKLLRFRAHKVVC